MGRCKKIYHSNTRTDKCAHTKFDFYVWLKDGMENVRFTEQGVQIEGRAEFLDSLYTEKIQSFSSTLIIRGIQTHNFSGDMHWWLIA
jgi:hypothetical protein